MAKYNNLFRVLIIVAIGALIFLMFPIFISFKVSSIYEVSAVNGVADLSGFSPDFFEQHVIQLTGDWDFYPNCLYNPNDFDSVLAVDKQTATIPHYWKKSSPDIPNAKGYSTYRLKILLPKELKNLGLYSRYQYSAYQGWLNDELLVFSGTVSQNMSLYESNYSPSVGYYYSDSEDTSFIYLTYQVQNYDHINGGLVRPIYFGSAQTVNFLNQFLLVINGIIIGLYIILFTYFMCGYINNNKRRDYMNYSIVTVFCLFASMTAFGESILYMLPPLISTGIIMRLEYLSVIYASFYCCTTYIEQYAPSFRHSRKIFAGILIFSIFTFVMPTYNVSMLHVVDVIISLLLVLVPFIYLLIKLIKQYSNEMLYEVISIFIILFGTLLNRVGFSPWDSVDLFSISICLHCILKMIAFFNHNSTVESNLKNLTETLELRIAQRTYELTLMKEKPKQQPRQKATFLPR